MQLAWRILLPGGHNYGDQLPFFIDWQGCPHPSEHAPGGCRLTDFRVSVADPVGYQRVMDALGVQVKVEASDHETLVANLDTPRGPVTLRHFRAESGLAL